MIFFVGIADRIDDLLAIVLIVLISKWMVQRWMRIVHNNKGMSIVKVIPLWFKGLFHRDRYSFSEKQFARFAEIYDDISKN